MKKLLEFLVCFFHPVAVVLVWINLYQRTDLADDRKLIWAVLALIPLAPFIYIFMGGDLW
jgi:hypothetical protein